MANIQVNGVAGANLHSKVLGDRIKGQATFLVHIAMACVVLCCWFWFGLGFSLGNGWTVVVAGTIASDAGGVLEELAAGFVDRPSNTGCGRGGMPDPGTGVDVFVG